MKTTYFIYGLFCPIDLIIKYVGLCFLNRKSKDKEQIHIDKNRDTIFNCKHRVYYRG